MNEDLILVDKNDITCGRLEKMEVHRLGLLHRAFSVFILNSSGELLLQQRADHKYHSGGLWTNTCCSHPRYGENTSDAVNRRLQEEMGMSCKTKFAFSFIYKAPFDNGLIEHEFDHVYVGVTNKQPLPAVEEVKNWKYAGLAELATDLKNNPQNYTEWFKICFPEFISYTNSLTFKSAHELISI